MTASGMISSLSSARYGDLIRIARIPIFWGPATSTSSLSPMYTASAGATSKGSSAWRKMRSSGFTNPAQLE